MFDTVAVLASQRQAVILSAVRERGAARIADLSAELNVSDMTVRRDLAELAERGLLRRVHGGAVGPNAASDEPGFAAKAERQAAEKLAIARAAAGLIGPGSTIALGAGTTTHALARTIAADASLRPLTVVTNSLPVADALYVDGVDVLLTGGTRTPSAALVGPLAEANLARLRVDQAFVGAHGIGVEAGLTTPNLAESATNRALVAIAGRTVALVDHTTWHATGLSVFAALTDLATIVTDDGLPEEQRATVRSLVDLVIAPTDSPDPTREPPSAQENHPHDHPAPPHRDRARRRP